LAQTEVLTGAGVETERHGSRHSLDNPRIALLEVFDPRHAIAQRRRYPVDPKIWWLIHVTVRRNEVVVRLHLHSMHSMTARSARAGMFRGQLLGNLFAKDEFLHLAARGLGELGHDLDSLGILLASQVVIVEKRGQRASDTVAPSLATTNAHDRSTMTGSGIATTATFAHAGARTTHLRSPWR
jgi:hypothetical protein